MESRFKNYVVTLAIFLLVVGGGFLLQHYEGNIEDFFAGPAIKPSVTVEYGKSIAASCIRCHHEDFAGGKIKDGDPTLLPARNLTMDEETGLGKWSESDFIKSIREGVRPDGSAISNEMSWARISETTTDEDLKAIWVFLKTLPSKTYDPKRP